MAQGRGRLVRRPVPGFVVRKEGPGTSRPRFDGQAKKDRGRAVPSTRILASALPWGCFVPKGHSTIAQRFNVGSGNRVDPSPAGTAENWYWGIDRPFGTHGFPTRNPTLKRWAILKHPSGMKTQILVALDSLVPGSMVRQRKTEDEPCDPLGF